MNTNKSLEAVPPSEKMDRRTFVRTLSGSAIVLIGGALLAGCGGSNSATGGNLGGGQTGGGIFAGRYAGSYNGTNNGQPDTGSFSFTVDSSGNIVAQAIDQTSGKTLNGTGTVNSSGSGSVTVTTQNLTVNFQGTFTLQPSGVVNVSGTYNGPASGSWSATTAEA